MTMAPSFVFVVDTCVTEEELTACKASISQALQFMPENAMVGLVSFGTHVQVHELVSSGCPRSYVLRGSKEYTSQQIKEQLGLAARPKMQQAVPGAAPCQRLFHASSAPAML